MEQSDSLYRKWLIEKSQWLLETDTTIVDSHSLIECLPGLRHARNRLARHANTDSILLYRGPLGSGKTILAEYGHQISNRRDKALVQVNSSAIPHELFEQYFYGRRKGASTGANYDIPGYFEEARNSTLFIDEVGDLPVLQQPKLLIALEYGRYRKVGALKDDFSNARIACATKLDLEELVRKGNIRDDFLSRIDDVVIEIPPLNDRREDIPHYIRYFLHESARIKSIESPIFEPEALAPLLFQDWSKENVRGLRKIVRQAVSECESSISADLIKRLLSEKYDSLTEHFDFFAERERWERQHIVSAILTSQGDDEIAAGILGATKRQFKGLKSKHRIRNSDVLK